MQTKARGPIGELPLTPDMLLHRPSGDIFALSQNAGMGWNPRHLNRREFLILSTQGGIRNPDGTPVALGYHTGHWEVGLLMQEAARAISAEGRHSVCRLLFRPVWNMRRVRVSCLHTPRVASVGRVQSALQLKSSGILFALSEETNDDPPAADA